MGTRADFYIGKGIEAEWIGSIAYDGYPDGIAIKILLADTEEIYRRRVTSFLLSLRHSILPEDGWPWPWKDSSGTNQVYAFFNGKVWLGHYNLQKGWRDPLKDLNEEYCECLYEKGCSCWCGELGIVIKEPVIFPDMSNYNKGK